MFGRAVMVKVVVVVARLGRVVMVVVVAVAVAVAVVVVRDADLRRSQHHQRPRRSPCPPMLVCNK